MIITCPECSTRFRVDENKIPAQGAKIRCARCKHVFAVTPPAPEPEPIIEETPAPLPEPQTDSFGTGTDLGEEETLASDSDFGFDDFDSTDIGSGANDEFDPAALDGDSDDDDESFAFGEEYGNVSLEGTAEESGDDEPFSFGEPFAESAAAPETAEPRSQEEFSFSPATGSQPDPLADSFNEDDSLDDLSMPPSEEEFAADMPPAAAAAKSSSRSPLSIVILFILILILAILIAGGVLVWKNGPGGLEQLISNLTGQPQVTEVEGTIRLTDLQGSFINNRKEGELFVIRGLAINDRSEAQAAIQVKGVIFDKSGNQLLQKTIFCGNPISDNDLRKLSFSKMEEMMGNQFGESLANLNVTPGQSIPFTIVFRKLPKTLSEFVVEVADSKPAAQ